jgi:hypothetical protein
MSEGHPLRNYARHVQKALVEEGLPRPPYTWCLRMVERAYADVKALETSKTKDDVKAGLVARILPAARLVQQVEGRYRMPTGEG